MIAWLALALALLALLLWVVAALLVVRLWRIVEPQVRPMLSMFAPPASSNTQPRTTDTPGMPPLNR